MASGFHQETNRNCCDGVDRISSLPDKAISEILVCLPIKEAVGTSKLSRTWRYRWMSIPELVFDEHAYAGGQASDDQRVSFINNVLLLHDGDITKFEIRGLSDYTSPYVDRWLLLLSRKKLTNLMIRFGIPNPYVCHTCLFYCEALSILKLQFCGLQLPQLTQFEGFKRLTVLDLFGVNANKETIEFLVNTSLLLENLRITHFDSAIWYLKISALNLRKCDIRGRCGGVIFVKTPELRHTDFNTYEDLDGLAFRCRLDGIVGGLDKIQKATFSNPYIEAWGKNFTYHHLNHLKLRIDFQDPEQVLAALWLSKSSPSLKTIDIIVTSTEKHPKNGLRDVDAIGNLEALYRIPGSRNDVLQRLETFDLKRFRGSEKELRFLQFFLLHASVLQTMKIGLLHASLLQRMKIGLRTDDTNCLKREGALKELVQFQRGSSGVKIKLYDLYDWKQ